MMTHKRLLSASVLCLSISLAALFFLVFGCAYLKSPKVATVHQDVTTAIADAGAAAFEAQREYTAGQLPQTPAVRTVINDLGSAYNDAKNAFLMLLNAESVYRGAQSQQLAACSPPTGIGTAAGPGPVPAASVSTPQATCQMFTQNVATAKSNLDKNTVALDAAVSQMVTRTNVVKALVPAK
jgi:hypothetical protein